MSLNHTHDTINKTVNGDSKNKAVKPTTFKDELEEKSGEDLMDGRTLLEAEALLIMLITRMKIKGLLKLGFQRLKTRLALNFDPLFYF